MQNYKIQEAKITFSLDKLDRTMPAPPSRMCTLAFEQELLDTMATIGRFEQLCGVLNQLTLNSVSNLTEARDLLKHLFEATLVLETSQEAQLDGGSQPTYRPLPTGGHWTEDYIQLKDGSQNGRPWAIDVPLGTPTHRAYPCLRVFLKPVP